MAISTGLVLKTLGGASVASLATTGIIFRNEISSFISGENTEKITKWDNDLIAEIKKTPSIAFTLNPETVDLNNLSTTITFSAKADSLKINNNNTDWTWECKITLDKGESQKNVFDSSQKTKFDEFLTNLKSSNNEKNNTKEKFIRNCAKERNDYETYKSLENLSTKSNKISSTVTFKLEDSGNNIKFSDDKFQEWFS